MPEWHLITSEYPPQLGGVSDYTYLVASGLASAGEAVHVWCPPGRGNSPSVPGVTVHRNLGRLRPNELRQVGRMIDGFDKPRRLLVQWVPHGYGYQAMNLFFCQWLWRRAVLHGDRLDLMVHEPYLPFGAGSWKQNAVAVVHRLMTVLLLSAAHRVWLAARAWEARWRPYVLGRHPPFHWLPVPSNVPLVDDSSAVAALRTRYAPSGEVLVGHFGTYGRHSAEFLRALLPPLLMRCSALVVLLLGRGGEKLREGLIRDHPALGGRLHASGPLPAAELSLHLGACDAMLQPYREGVNSRNGSMMAALAHGLPVITTTGPLTEPLWAEGRAVLLTPDGDVAAMEEAALGLLAGESERRRLGTAAKAFYDEFFAIRHTIAALRETA